ncbi:MAG: class I SAM-dependent methyltransferase [Cyanobacteria bacterium]|nr:class I SAM-dependent methyltransferase [Cyanobacteriota bacterium]
MLHQITTPETIQTLLDRDIRFLKDHGLTDAIAQLGQIIESFNRDRPPLGQLFYQLGSFFYRLKRDLWDNPSASDICQDKQYEYFGAFFYSQGQGHQQNGDLWRYFQSNQLRPLINKWIHYFDVYESHFQRFRGQPITLVEIGVFKGGSLGLWRHYFGEEAIIYGIDVDPACQQFAQGNTKIIIGDQGDRAFLKSLLEQLPPMDILIDDGGHTMEQQIATFEVLYPHIKDGGVYLCEDCHTSYWSAYGGSDRGGDTFLEYSKNWVDSLHYWHQRSPYQEPDAIAQSAKSIHFYDSIVAIEKVKKTPPFWQKIGWQQTED